jgi:hypothetical protein
MAGGERPSTTEARFRRFMEGLREIDRLPKASVTETATKAGWLDRRRRPSGGQPQTIVLARRRHAAP